MQIKEKIIEKILLLVALSSIFILGLITFFIFEEGVPLIFKIGPKAFLFGEKWIPSKGLFGIFPMIVSSFWVTFGALLLGIPLGLSCAVFLREWVPPIAAMILRPTIQLLAAIPSVIYGLNPGGDVSQPDSRLRFILPLASGSMRPKGFDDHLMFEDVWIRIKFHMPNLAARSRGNGA